MRLRWRSKRKVLSAGTKHICSLSKPLLLILGFWRFVFFLLLVLETSLLQDMSTRADQSPEVKDGLFGKPLQPNAEGAPEFIIAVHHYLLEHGKFWFFIC